MTRIREPKLHSYKRCAVRAVLGKTVIAEAFRQSWVTVSEGPAFSEKVDFHPGVPGHVQDAVESALRASGTSPCANGDG